MLKKVLLIFLVLVFAGSPVFALEMSDLITINAYGGWAYGKTDEYVTDYGNKDGAYDNAKFNLAVAASKAILMKYSSSFLMRFSTGS